MKKRTLIAGAVAILALVIVSLTTCHVVGRGTSDNRLALATDNAAARPRAAADAPAAAPAPSAVASPAADQTITYVARSGSKMRIEGTANVLHTTWQIESPFVGGMLEVGPGFPTEPGQAVTPGKVEAKGNVFVRVRSLKSVEDDGKPYSDSMDDIMCEHLKEAQFKQIDYRLTELTLKEAPKAKDAPYVFEAKGELTIAGVTNKTTMTVNILPLADKKLEITGSTAVKMTDYKVEPVDKNIVVAHIKTGNEVKLVFKWMVGQRKVQPPA